MENSELMFEYSLWLLIIVITLGLFMYFSKKYSSAKILFPIVFFPTWIIIAFLKGVGKLFLQNINMLNSIPNYALLIAETFPMMFLFSGITFFVKYRRLKKSNSL